jgi:hypothetical protein
MNKLLLIILYYKSKLIKYLGRHNIILQIKVASATPASQYRSLPVHLYKTTQ